MFRELDENWPHQIMNRKQQNVKGAYYLHVIRTQGHKPTLIIYSKGPNCRVGLIKGVGGPIFGRTYMAIRIYLVIFPNLGPNKVM